MYGSVLRLTHNVQKCIKAHTQCMEVYQGSHTMYGSVLRLTHNVWKSIKAHTQCMEVY